MKVLACSAKLGAPPSSDTSNNKGTVDGINPALPIIRNIPYVREFRVLKVMQDLYHQQ